jgi:hypothetical protein
MVIPRIIWLFDFELYDPVRDKQILFDETLNLTLNNRFINGKTVKRINQWAVCFKVAVQYLRDITS